MTNFDRAFAFVVGEEGGYTCDPDDAGNWTSGVCKAGLLRGTKYGISAKSYPTLDIQNLTLDQAREIYRRDYWTPLGCESYTYGKALCLFDCGVNQGVARALALMTLVPASMPFVPTFQAERAMKYVVHPKFAIYGRGWMRRLIRIAIEASKETT